MLILLTPLATLQAASIRSRKWQWHSHLSTGLSQVERLSTPVDNEGCERERSPRRVECKSHGTENTRASDCSCLSGKSNPYESHIYAAGTKSHRDYRRNEKKMSECHGLAFHKWNKSSSDRDPLPTHCDSARNEDHSIEPHYRVHNSRSVSRDWSSHGGHRKLHNHRPRKINLGFYECANHDWVAPCTWTVVEEGKCYNR